MAEHVLENTELTTNSNVTIPVSKNTPDELEDEILTNEVASTDEMLYCGPCLDDNQQLPAEGFCVTCNEYLCEHCYKGHRLPRPVRDHILKSEQEMPRIRPQKTEPVTREDELCPFHRGQYITSFCNEHKQLCCDHCVEVAHGLCKDMKGIDELSADIENDEEFQEFLNVLHSLHAGYKETKSTALFQMKEVDWYYEKTLSSFKQTLDQRRQKDMENMTNTVNVCDKVLGKLRMFIETVQNGSVEKDYKGLYIKMKYTPVQTDVISDNLERLNKANHFGKYVFDSTESPTSFGILKCVSKLHSTISTGEVGCCQLVLRENKELSAVHKSHIVALEKTSKKIHHCLEFEFKVGVDKGSDDGSEEGFEGEFEDVFEDFWNGKVVFLQSNTIRNIRYKYNNIQTWNPCYWKSIQLKESFSLAAFMGEQLIAFTYNPCKVVEIDSSGNTTRVIHETPCDLTFNCDPFIGNPSSAVLDKKTNVLYVTDAAMDSVYKITDGDIHCIVKSVRLASPKGIALANDGTLIVCCTKGKCVVRVTLDGQIYSFIGPLDFEPSAVAYDAETSVVYVGGNCDSIHIFSVSDEYPRDVKSAQI